MLFVHRFIQSIYLFTFLNFKLLIKLFGRKDVKPRVTKPKLTCCQGKCLYCIEHHKHHWKQSSLCGNIQKLKPAINHQPVYHWLSGKRSAVWNSRDAVSFCHADHRKIGLWRRLMPISRLSYWIYLLCYPSDPWFDSRYVKIVKTSHYKKIFSSQRSKIWLSCLWLSLALYLLIVRVTNWLRIEFVQSYAVCVFAFSTSESQVFHYCTTFGLLLFYRCLSAFSVVKRYFSKPVSISIV